MKREYFKTRKEAEDAELLYIAPTDELTYPFRGVSRESLSYAYFVSALASPFVKPSIPLTPEGAQTPTYSLRLCRRWPYKE